jgi:branched-chain amino acid transport system permease protein
MFLIGIFVYTKNVTDSRIGRALFAVHEKEEVAGVIGINPTKYKLKVFTLSAIYAGLAGSLYAHYATYISEETFSFFFSITLVCGIVIGGLGSVWGSIIGTFILFSLSEVIRYLAKFQPLPNLMKTILAEYSYHLIIYGLVLAVFVIFIPNGIVSLFSKKGGD